MMRWIASSAMMWALLGVMPSHAAGAGETVVVIYNKNLPASKELAQHYAARRAVPSNQLFGVDVSANSEVMSRAEFRDKLEKPIYDWLVQEKLFTPNPQPRTPNDTQYRSLIEAKIRYLVLCYGIPLRILRDTDLKEEGSDKVQEQVRARNDAAVDADLAVLPFRQGKLLLTGPLGNPFYLTTNAMVLHPTNGVLMVARLDGPTVEIARSLMDKAIEAESNGLWGRAYVDSRGITNGEFKIGDDWMRGAAAITRRMGFETELDEKEALFSAGHPMSHIAFYAGWYDMRPQGPFTLPTVEFMPGAFAYHLYSFSGNTLRQADESWAATLLAKGATITMGCVDEPYLTGTPNIAGFLERLIFRRWTFGEAAYCSQPALSWQTTVVGDPLYQPFRQPPDALHFKLEREKSPLLAWSHLRVVGLNQATALPLPDLIKYIEDNLAVATNNAVMQEKLAQLLVANNQPETAVAALVRATKLKPTPQQNIRLLTTLAELQVSLGRTSQAIETCQQLLAANPRYPEAERVYRDLAALARKLGKSRDAKKLEKEAERLATPK
jgi:uncharacterized protein (TIGR03790 family)